MVLKLEFCATRSFKLKRPWSKLRKKNKEPIKVFIEVHQNGELLSKTDRLFNKRGSIYLSSNPNAELNAPFYGLPSEIKILSITHRGVEIDLDPNWEGFTTCDGKIEDISSDRRSAYTHIMKKGDYGSIAYNDLRILIRIGKDRHFEKSSLKTSPEYVGSKFDFWIGSKIELKYLLVSSAVCCWLFGSFILGLLFHPDSRPKDFIDLRNEYTLPFIHPDHLRNIPESLQTQFDRAQPLRSALEFARGFADLIVGYNLNMPRKDPLFEESRKKYLIIHSRKDEAISNFEDSRREIERVLLSDSRNSLISIPHIKGETFSGSLLRLEDRVKTWHQSAKITLQERRRVRKEFSADPNYRSTRPAKGQVGLEDTPEETLMYKETQQLAELAESQQQKIREFRQPLLALSAKEAAPIAIAKTSNAFALSEKRNYAKFNQRTDSILASSFNPDKPRIVREPLIGSIDPKLIESTISKYRFELQLCYELALRRNQQSGGTMEWQWHLDSQGTVYDIELVSSNISDTKMVECIRDKIATWKWPRPSKGSIQVSYPFSFRPAKG